MDILLTYVLTEKLYPVFVCFDLDGGEPNGDDKFPGGSGKNAGDSGTTSEKKSEKRDGAILSSSGIQHLRPSGQHSQ